MKNPYLIIYNNFKNPEDEILFSEAISSNFVSKKVRDNGYAIINDKKLPPIEIHSLIKKSANDKANFLVIQLDNCFGSFHTSGIHWLKEKFPDSEWFD